MIGVQINDRHTYRDWGLKWLGCEIPMPEVKTISADVPGLDGVLDYTEALTDQACFANRELVMTFDRLDQSLTDWQKIYSEIADYCHGKVCRMVLDTDPSYYYTGRVSVSAAKDSERVTQVAFTMDAQPYKYEISGSTGDWLWDSFRFEDGVVREYGALRVSGEREICCIGVQRPVIPVITCSAGMVLHFAGQDYNLTDQRAGNRVVEVVLQPNVENRLIFTGDGTVTIDYRGSVL